MKHIVIVGGGTAGWMAAIMLSRRFPDKRITVVDPAAIEAIGVGESVTGVVQQFVADPLHGLSKSDLFRRADATLKMGIWFKDWFGADTEYLAPIDAPTAHFQHGYDVVAEEFYAMATADGLRLGDVQINARLMRTNRTDYFREDGSISDRFARSSCHFDALKFAEWLKEVSQKCENVTHVDDIMQSFEQNSETGHVTRILTESGRAIEGDFFLDCTGFHRRLLQRAYAVEWIDFSRYIKVDSAILAFSRHAEDRELPVYTLAQALPHGWMWQIPTQSRLGQGYVFSSKYVSEEQAIDEFRGAGVDVGESPRILRFRPGKLASQWVNNVCAIGLAGGFIEPLESTTIHGMYVQTKLLADLLLPFYTPDASAALSQQYNYFIDVMYRDYVDFVSFHYHSGRCDTEFWRDYQKEVSITDANRTRMEKWAHVYPMREDFSSEFTRRVGHTTGILIWMPMLCGMGYLQPAHARRVLQISRHFEWARENVARYLSVHNLLAEFGIRHQEAIRYLRGD